MELSKRTLTMLQEALSPNQLESVMVAIKEEDKLATWKIEGKNNVDDDWIHICSNKTECEAKQVFNQMKSYTGGCYRLLNPMKYVVDEVIA